MKTTEAQRHRGDFLCLCVSVVCAALAACGKEPPKPPVRLEPPATALTALEEFWSLFDGLYDEKNAELLGGAVTKEEIAEGVKWRKVAIVKMAKALKDVTALAADDPVAAAGWDKLDDPAVRAHFAYLGKVLLFTLFELESLPAYRAKEVDAPSADRLTALGLKFVSDAPFCRALLGAEPKIASQGGAMAAYVALHNREYPEASKLVEEATQAPAGSVQADVLRTEAGVMLALARSAPECLAAAKALRILAPDRLEESHVIELAYQRFYKCNEVMRVLLGEKAESKFGEAVAAAKTWLETAKPSEKFEARVQPLIDAKQFDEAIGVCRDALDIKPGDADALIMLRRALAARGP